MAGLINGINYYYNVYSINKTTSNAYNPMGDMLKISAASKMYSYNYTKNFDPALSDYFNSLTKNTYLFKTVTSTIQYNNYDSSFNKKAMTASSSSITGIATQKADVKDYTVNVKSLAEKQINTGSKLASYDQVDTGLNTFSIKLDNGTSKNISFVVDHTDTNRTYLEKMARSINNSNTGLKANVINEPKNRTSYLNIEGKTGAKNTYTLEDVSGDAVEKTNANHMSASSKDAELTVDGKQYTSEDNSLKLDNGNVTLNFSKAEAINIKVSVGADKNVVKRTINDLVVSYNSMIDFSVRYSAEYSGANTLNHELGDIVDSKKTLLAEIGITVNRDNSLTIDGKKLDKSLGEDFVKVRETVAGHGGLGDMFNQKADEVLTKQYKYAKPSELSPNYSEVGNYFTPNYKMPYMQNLNLGYIINTMA